MDVYRTVGRLLSIFSTVSLTFIYLQCISDTLYYQKRKYKEYGLNALLFHIPKRTLMRLKAEEAYQPELYSHQKIHANHQKEIV